MNQKLNNLILPHQKFWAAKLFTYLIYYLCIPCDKDKVTFCFIFNKDYGIQKTFLVSWFTYVAVISVADA